MKVLVNDGLKFVCHTDQELWRARTLLTKEPGTIAWLNRVLQAGDVFYDIGANVGCYALYAARLVGPAGRVYAFEPHPATALALARNVAANGFEDRVRVTTAPLWRDSGVITFRCQSLVSGTSHHGGEAGIPLSMWACSLDDWFWSHRRDDEQPRKATVVKMDVDGAEPQILRGARTSLEHVRSLQVEIDPRCRVEAELYLAERGYAAAGTTYTKDGANQIASGADPAAVIANVVYERVAVPA